MFACAVLVSALAIAGTSEPRARSAAAPTPASFWIHHSHRAAADSASGGGWGGHRWWPWPQRNPGGWDGWPVETPTDNTPPSPPAELAAAGVTQSEATVSWSASSDDSGVDHYELSVNGEPQGSVGSSPFIVALQCGETAEITVTAVDAAGNRATGDPLSVIAAACADTAPPSVPAGLEATSVTRDSAHLGWDPASDDTGVSGYAVYSGGTEIAMSVTNSVTVPLTCGTTAGFSVSAFDDAGNESDVSPELSVTAADCPDTAAPSPPGELTATNVTADSALLRWTAATDAVGVGHYDVFSGSAKLGSTAQTNFGLTLACGATSDFSVVAVDAAGNASAPATVSVVAPGCPDTSAPSTPTDLAAAGVTQTSALLSWSPSGDDVGVERYDVFAGATRLASVRATSYTVPLTCGVTSDFSVIAYDAAGNASAGAPISVTAADCPPAGGPAPVGVGGDWSLKFADEFNGDTLDTSVWDTQRGPDGAAHYGDPYNADIEDAYYSNANASVADGSLALTLKPEATSGYPYSSGMIDSGNAFSFKYGYIESRVKVPKCDGCWPAFWMLDAPVDSHWPPEIDIFEMFNTQSDTRPNFNYHWQDGSLQQSGPAAYGDAGVDYTSDWHTYGLLWTADKLQVYIDGKPGPSYTDASKITQVANYVILNLGHYKGTGQGTNAQMLVDYVRVWQ